MCISRGIVVFDRNVTLTLFKKLPVVEIPSVRRYTIVILKILRMNQFFTIQKRLVFLFPMPCADYPDLIIRTGGETRLSNFLLYQAAYSELFFTDVHFPSFRKVDFLRVIRAYQQRKRRCGR